MDVRHLRTFAMLAEELHFGRTALRLNTSQPVVSRTVKELERDVGVTLVERSARRVSLTRAGRLFLARARTALENIAAGTREARSGFSNDIDSVRLGVLIGTAQPFSGSLLTAFQKAHPLATVSLVTLTERTLATALTERHVDAAIASNDCLPGHLNRLEIGQAEIEIFVGDGHFLSDRTAIAFDCGRNIFDPRRPPCRRYPVINDRRTEHGFRSAQTVHAVRFPAPRQDPGYRHGLRR